MSDTDHVTPPSEKPAQAKPVALQAQPARSGTAGRVAFVLAALTVGLSGYVTYTAYEQKKINAGLDATINKLQQDILALKAAPVASVPMDARALDEFRAELLKQREALEGLNHAMLGAAVQMGELETKKIESAGVVPESVQQSLVAWQLRQALLSGRDFSGELSALENTVPAVKEWAEIKIIAAHATIGIPTRAELQAEAYEQLADWRYADVRRTADAWWERLTAALTRVAHIRKVSEHEPKDALEKFVVELPLLKTEDIRARLAVLPQAETAEWRAALDLRLMAEAFAAKLQNVGIVSAEGKGGAS